MTWTWWRTAWLVVLVLAVGAGVYASVRYAAYGRAKAEQLLQDGQSAEAELRLTDALVAYDGAVALRGVAAASAAEAASRAATIHAAKGRTEDEQSYLRRAVSLQGGEPRYAAALVRSLVETRDLDEAQQVLDDALRSSPEDAQLLVVAARLELARQSSDGARDFARRAVDADEKNAEAVLLDALLRVHTAPAEAATAFQAVLSLTKEQSLLSLAQVLRPIAQQIDVGLDSEAYEHVLVAATLLDRGEDDAALLEATAAIEVDDAYRDAWVYRGVAELHTNALDAAASSLARAKELDPTFGYTRFALGQLAVARGDRAAAVSELREAIELGYDTTELRVELADVLVVDGKVGDAREVLTGALDDAPTDRALHQALFWLEFGTVSDFKAAKKAAASFAEDLPKDALAQGLAALAAHALDDDKTARTKAEAAIRADGKIAVAFLVLGLLDNDRGQLQHAIDLDVEGHVSVQAQSALAAE